MSENRAPGTLREAWDAGYAAGRLATLRDAAPRAATEFECRTHTCSSCSAIRNAPRAATEPLTVERIGATVAEALEATKANEWVALILANPARAATEPAAGRIGYWVGQLMKWHSHDDPGTAAGAQRIVRDIIQSVYSSTLARATSDPLREALERMLRNPATYHDYGTLRSGIEAALYRDAWAQEDERE